MKHRSLIHVRLAFVVPSLLTALFASGRAGATDYYVDPAAGAVSGDGTQAKPWQTLEGVVSAGHVGKEIKAGDTVLLLSGYHGTLTVKNGTYSPAITIRAASGQMPELAAASFSGTHGWVLDGVTVSPSFLPMPKKGGDMIRVDKSSSDVVITNCSVFSVTDSSGWTADDWINTASNAFQISGDHVTVSHSSAKNVRFGISVDGPNALVDSNQVVNFSGDGMRGLGDNDVFQYNLVKNAYASEADGDDNHDDGFQSWSVGTDGTPGDGVVTGVVLRGNMIINREDPNQKFQNSLQGFGCFDGFYDGWVVENNVVITDHWHGISLYGAKNSRIVNNTVIDNTDGQPGPPWIMVTAHKNGTPSENVIVRNNLATDYDVSGNMITQDHNVTLMTLTDYFVNPAKFDLHLLATSPAKDKGSADQAPALDADRIARPQGSAVDLGAYEWHEATVMPVGGSSGTGTGGAGAGGTSGGAGASSGGTSSSGGAAAGGKTSAGTGGSAGTSNASGGGGAGGAAANESGGTESNDDGGSTAGAAGESSKAGAAGKAAASSGDSSGCGCRVGSATSDADWPVALVFGLPWLLGVRRRRRR